MTTSPRTQPNEPLRTWYPYLWTWVNSQKQRHRSAIRNAEDTLLTVLGDEGISELTKDTALVDDLKGSLSTLTVRLAPLKKRPTPRLKQMALWNAAIELETRRVEAHNTTSEINDALSGLCTDTGRLSDLLQPTDPETFMKRALMLGCCSVGPQPRFNATAPTHALEQLTAMNLDGKDVYILRNSVIALQNIGIERIAETLGVTRQTVWNRGKVLLQKIQELSQTEPFTELAQAIRRYRLPEDREGVEPWDVIYDLREKPIGFLINPSSGHFPTFTDLWQILFFISSGEPLPWANWDVPPGFSWGFPGVAPHILCIQDAMLSDYDDDNPPQDDQEQPSKQPRRRKTK